MELVNPFSEIWRCPRSSAQDEEAGSTEQVYGIERGPEDRGSPGHGAKEKAATAPHTHKHSVYRSGRSVGIRPEVRRSRSVVYLRRSPGQLARHPNMVCPVVLVVLDDLPREIASRSEIVLLGGEISFRFLCVLVVVVVVARSKTHRMRGTEIGS